MKIFLFSILFFLGVKASSQTDSIVLPKNESNRLRVNMILIDTTANTCPCNLNPEYSLYKFRINQTFEGKSDRGIVGVCAREEDILQFNPLKETGKEYWWVLCKECTVSKLPVYRLCGKF